MSEQKINQAVYMAAAQMAFPALAWQTTVEGLPFAWEPEKWFDPLTSDDDAMKLERALKKEGWVFYQTPKGKYVAFDIHGRPESDDSDTLLLLKCVSAMTGIPVYRDSAILSKE